MASRFLLVLWLPVISAEWTEIFRCGDENLNKGPRSNYSLAAIQQMALEATSVQICSSKFCATSRAGSQPIHNLRDGLPLNALYGDGHCDEDCLKRMWTNDDTDRALGYMWHKCPVVHLTDSVAYNPAGHTRLWYTCGSQYVDQGGTWSPTTGGGFSADWNEGGSCMWEPVTPGYMGPLEYIEWKRTVIVKIDWKPMGGPGSLLETPESDDDLETEEWDWELWGLVRRRRTGSRWGFVRRRRRFR